MRSTPPLLRRAWQEHRQSHGIDPASHDFFAQVVEVPAHHVNVPLEADLTFGFVKHFGVLSDQYSLYF